MTSIISMNHYYDVFDSRAEVSGELVLSMMDCRNHKNINPILAYYGLVDVQTWYKQQMLLDIFSTIQAESSEAMFDLVSIGIRLIERLNVPEAMQNVDYERMLRMQNEIYQSYHRGGDVGHHYVVKLGDQHYRIIADTPYPTDFEFGLLHGQAKRFMPQNTSYTISYDDNFVRKAYGQGAKMILQWA